MFKHAYGAGWRAGMSPRAIQRNEDGTKNLVIPPCPFTGRFQFLSRFFWHEGFHDGTMKQTTNWLNRRRVVQ